jgi:hypothetical protein
MKVNRQNISARLQWTSTVPRVFPYFEMCNTCASIGGSLALRLEAGSPAQAEAWLVVRR